MRLYPINLNIAGRLCIVVGGGGVAARKIKTLLLSDALVRVISPELSSPIRPLVEQGRIEWLRRSYRSGDLTGAFLVFAATDDAAVQQQVAEQAAAQNVLLNSADDTRRCDFQLPAQIRRGDLLITVSTGGGSPALSALIRRRIGQEFGPEYGLLIGLMAKLRQQVVGGLESSERNRLLFRAVLELPVLEYIRQRRWHELQQQLAEILPASVDSARLVGELERDFLGCEQMRSEQI